MRRLPWASSISQGALRIPGMKRRGGCADTAPCHEVSVSPIHGMAAPAEIPSGGREWAGPLPPGPSPPCPKQACPRPTGRCLMRGSCRSGTPTSQMEPKRASPPSRCGCIGYRPEHAEPSRHGPGVEPTADSAATPAWFCCWRGSRCDPPAAPSHKSRIFCSWPGIPSLPSPRAGESSAEPGKLTSSSFHQRILSGGAIDASTRPPQTEWRPDPDGARLPELSETFI